MARGVKMGPKFKLTLQQVAHARQLLEQGEYHNTVARSLGVSRRTL
jgi:DNA invertase Pin-like site-specific DNA recombinase